MTGIAGLAHPQMSLSHSRFMRRGVSPCCFFNRASDFRNVCNAKPFAPRLMVPSLPSREGEETHIESITKE